MKKRFSILLIGIFFCFLLVSCDIGKFHLHTYKMEYNADSHYYICDCGKIKSEALHKFSEWEETKAPTCTELGKKTKSCSCGYKIDEDIEALGHDLQYVASKAPTCASEGYEAHEKCSRCDYSTIKIISALPHELVHVEKKNRSCEEDGHNEYDYCKNCSYSTKIEYKALGHDLVHVDELSATCELDGHNAYEYCKNCSYTTKITYPKTNHSYENWEVVVPASCSNIGIKRTTCSKCNEVIEEEIPKLEHDFDITENYMGNPLKTYYECKKCGFSYVKGIGDNLNSQYGYSELLANNPLMASYYEMLNTACLEIYNSKDDLIDQKIVSIDCNLPVYLKEELFEIFYYENPWYFFMLNSFSYNSTQLSISMSEEYLLYSKRKEVIDAMALLEAKCLNLINDEMTPLTKYLIIHDLILEECEYAYVKDSNGNYVLNGKDKIPEDSLWAHNISGLLLKKEGVCEAYSKTFYYLCKLLGLDCIFISGKSYGGGHAWNMIKLDDKWYPVDTTWDDDNNLSKYKYFLSSKAKFENGSSHVNDTFNYLTYPVADISGIKLVKLYESQDFYGAYSNISNALASMNNIEKDYTVELITDYNTNIGYTITDYTYEIGGIIPNVNSITIKSEGEVTNSISLTNNLKLQSKLTFNNIYVKTNDYYLNIGNNQLLFDGDYNEILGNIYIQAGASISMLKNNNFKTSKLDKIFGYGSISSVINQFTFNILNYSSKIYLYSETTSIGNYYHFVDDNIVIW